MSRGVPGESRGEEDRRVEERRRVAMEMRLAGVDLATIAEKVPGYSSATHVSMDLKRARDRSKAQLDEKVEDLRDLQVDRLERMMRALWPKVLKGDTKAVETAAKLIIHMSDLRGLKAPTKIELQHRIEVETTIVAETVIAVVDSLGLPPEARLLALETAQQRLLAIGAGDDTGSGG